MNSQEQSGQIITFDTTLRDAEQSPGAFMVQEEKMRIAMILEHMGVDVIEAGFPVSSKCNFKSVRTTAAKALKNDPVSVFQNNALSYQVVT